MFQTQISVITISRKFCTFHGVGSVFTENLKDSYLSKYTFHMGLWSFDRNLKIFLFKKWQFLTQEPWYTFWLIFQIWWCFFQTFLWQHCKNSISMCEPFLTNVDSPRRRPFLSLACPNFANPLASNKSAKGIDEIY